MRLTDILRRLDGVSEDHDGHVALCPAHADRRTPSLKLTLKDDGKLLLVCRAGCEKDKILTALSLRESDLFDVDGQGARTVSSAAPEAVGVAEIAGLRAFVDETSAALANAEDAQAYLLRRFGLAADVAADLGIGYAAPGPRPQPWLSRSFTRHPRITVPLCDFEGVARGLQGRDIGGKCPSRWVSLANVPGKTWAKWGYLSAGAGYDTVIVTEGPGDGLTSVAIGYDAIMIRGASLARNPDVLRQLIDGLRGRDIVLAGDPDNAGNSFTEALGSALVAEGQAPRRLSFPNAGEDVTAWRERDPEVFPAEFHRAVRQAEVFVPRSPEPPPSAPTPAVAATDAALDIMGASARQVFDATDVGIAVMLRDYMTRNGGGVRYARGLGFLVWDGKVWAPDHDHVRNALHQMGAELLASGEDSKRHLALKALTNRSIDAVMKELPAVPGVPASAADFDADPDLLSVANGTLNLRTGELRPHRPEDMITRRLEVAYRPDAQCPRWLRFLEEVFPRHPELPAYMRRLVGYGITGSTSAQVLVFMHGGGANGKSVLLDAILHVFRGITKSTEFSTFEQRAAVGQASPELAALRAARIVTASETEKYSRIAEALIKQVTGGDPVTARQLYGSPFTYVPQFLIMVAGNYKPAILSQDYGIWRRVKLVPFEATFKGKDADPTLPAQLRDEAEGILAWAVRGAMEWYEHGLQEPDTVATATQEYRQSEDRLAEFISARLTRESDAQIAPMVVRRSYAEWAEDAGLSRKEVLSGWALGVELESRGFPKKRKSPNSGPWFFHGIRLATDAELTARKAEETIPVDEPTGSTDIFGQQREEAA